MFPYTIIRSGRRTTGITISPGKGVVVRAPYRASEEEIMFFVESRSGWIKHHLMRFETLIRLDRRACKNGDVILFRGKEYDLRTGAAAKSGMAIDGQAFELKLPSEASESRIQRLVEVWYRKNAEAVLNNSFGEILLLYSDQGFSPARFTIRKMKRKWGSCSSKGRITINSVLIKLDDELHRYVMVHELCHLVHPDHGKDFYNLLGALCPLWKVYRKRLRQYTS